MKVFAFAFFLFLAGCKSEAVVVEVGNSPVVPVFAPAPAHQLELRPEDRQALDTAGWLNYVEDNIETIQYFDYYALSDDGKIEWWGQAQLVDGKRNAKVTTKRSRLSVLRTIIHEANHWKAYRETGSYSSQKDAADAEEEFEIACLLSSCVPDAK